MLLLNVNWSDAFTILGLGMLIVFSVLILLVFLLNFSGWIFTRKTNTEENIEVKPTVISENETFSEEEKAAIAMALHLFYEDVHDEESYVITIDDTNTSSAWNSKMYNLNNLI
jgi:sodium pump decarboxylase gamma subunit